MDENQVACALVSALPGKIEGREILEACREFPRRLLAVTCPPILDPSIDLATWMKTCRENRVAAVKLHVRFGGFSLDSDRVETAVAHAVEVGLPVMVCGLRANWESPSPLERITRWADAYPNHSFILAHAGGHNVLDAWEMARTRANLYLDLSHTLFYYAGSSVEKDIGFVARRLDRRVLFGSDFPESDIGESIRSLDRHLERWTGVDRAGILGGNWVGILRKHGIELSS